MNHAADHPLARPSAQVVVPLVLSLTNARSVVDVGCGIGTWLDVARSAGCKVFGVDMVPAERSLLADDEYLQADLTEPLHLERRADLCMSLETAEHLPGAASATFVASLVSVAPVVLFSAAQPGQGGPGHVNEQPPAYWAKLFAAHDYQPHDWLRLTLWDDPRVAWWYRQNTVLYAAPNVLSGPPPPPAIRHPAAAPPPTLGSWVRELPRLARHSVDARVRQRARRRSRP